MHHRQRARPAAPAKPLHALHPLSHAAPPASPTGSAAPAGQSPSTGCIWLFSTLRSASTCPSNSVISSPPSHCKSADRQVRKHRARKPRIHRRRRPVIHPHVVPLHLRFARNGETPHRAAQHQVLIHSRRQSPSRAAAPRSRRPPAEPLRRRSAAPSRSRSQVSTAAGSQAHAPVRSALSLAAAASAATASEASSPAPRPSRSQTRCGRSHLRRTPRRPRSSHAHNHVHRRPPLVIASTSPGHTSAGFTAT